MHQQISNPDSSIANSAKQELLIQAGLRRRYQPGELAEAKAKMRSLAIPERFAVRAMEYSALND